VSVFAEVGGVPTRLRLHSVSDVVKGLPEDGDRELTEECLRLENRHGSDAVSRSLHVCNMEYRAGYCRSSMVVPVRERG
jgi:hypothetical protein